MMNNKMVETAEQVARGCDITQTALYLVIAILCAFCISVAFTPVIRVLAFKFKVTDVPKDNRRMHKKEMPLMGGLAIFILGVQAVYEAIKHIKATKRGE